MVANGPMNAATAIPATLLRNRFARTRRAARRRWPRAIASARVLTRGPSGACLKAASDNPQNSLGEDPRLVRDGSGKPRFMSSAEKLRWSEPNDATPFLPERKTLKDLREAAANCRGCPLWRDATQTVFGEGLKKSRLMFVGEMPGDKEDRAGTPFVGPAGRELDKALEAAGIAREEVYVTNAVKHFAFIVKGNRRLHQTPKRFHVEACKPWLDSELEVVKPEALVMLGATAGKALLGPKFKLGESRGRPLDSELAPLVTATAHPSSILRQRDDTSRHAERRAFTEDLERVAELMNGSG